MRPSSTQCESVIAANIQEHTLIGMLRNLVPQRSTLSASSGDDSDDDDYDSSSVFPNPPLENIHSHPLQHAELFHAATHLHSKRRTLKVLHTVSHAGDVCQQKVDQCIPCDSFNFMISVMIEVYLRHEQDKYAT